MVKYTRLPPESRSCKACGAVFAPATYNQQLCESCRVICRMPGCWAPVRVRGYCNAHATVSHNVVPVPVRSGGLCGIDGCERLAFAAGHCSMHYNRVRLKGEAGTAAPRLRKAAGVPCEVEGCERPALGDGLCGTHYARRRKTGLVGEAALQRAAQGEGTITETGYRKIIVDGAYVFEHRHIMERSLGRSLLPGENVHHRNGNRQDNRPENLEVWISQQPAGQRVTDLVAHAISILKKYPDELADEGFRLLPLESAEATDFLMSQDMWRFGKYLASSKREIGE